MCTHINVLLRPVHTKYDNYKDNYISIHTEKCPIPTPVKMHKFLYGSRLHMHKFQISHLSGLHMQKQAPF